MEHHSDWVNDLVVLNNGELLISASSDQSLKVWNSTKSYCMSTIRTHKDYVSSLAYAPETNKLISAGFDDQIYLWDVNAIATLTVDNSEVTCMNLHGATNSIYCVDTDPQANLVVAGGTEKLIRLWDPRTQEKLMKLRGHKDNVRAVKLSRDGTQCVSASSDGTVRLWSIGEQRVIRVFQLSEHGIWALQTDEHFRWMYAGGRQADVTAISLIEPDINYCVGRESAPILSLCLDQKENTLWTSTTTGISKWRLAPDNQVTREKLASKSDHELAAPYSKASEWSLKSIPPIIDHKVLPNRRYILTKNSENQVFIYDVLLGRCIKNLGSADFAKTIESYAKTLYVPSWFSVDLKCGFLQIVLEENDCFQGQVATKHVDLNFDFFDENSRVNLGRFMLVSIFQNWANLQKSLESAQSRPESLAGSETGSKTDTECFRDDVKDELEDDHTIMKKIIQEEICLPKSTPILIHESNGAGKCRVLWNMIGQENIANTLTENIPQWVKDGVLKTPNNNCVKVQFCLQPMTANIKKPLPILKKDKLTAGDMLLIRKVAKHVFEKINVLENERIKEVAEDELTKMANQNIEIWCNETLLDPDFDLRTVKHLIWKRSVSIELFYKKKVDSDLF